MKYEPMLYDAGKKMPGVYRSDMRFGPDGSLERIEKWNPCKCYRAR